VLCVAPGQARGAGLAVRSAVPRAARPAAWRTGEARHGLGPAIAREAGNARTILVDCLTLLVSNCMEELVMNEGDDTWVDASLWLRVEHEARDLLDAAAGLDLSLVLLYNEVWMGMLPHYPAGRLYRVVLGRVCTIVAT